MSYSRVSYLLMNEQFWLIKKLTDFPNTAGTRNVAIGLQEEKKNLLICNFHIDLCLLWACNFSFISLKSVQIGVVYN